MPELPLNVAVRFVSDKDNHNTCSHCGTNPALCTMLRWCNLQVVKCFKCMERAADAVTGVAGPFFVGFACLLISVGVVIFCKFIKLNILTYLVSLNFVQFWLTQVEVIAPTLPYPLINIPICMLIASNLLAHYYYVCTIHPGRPDDGLGTGEGQGWNWAPKRGGKGVKWSPVTLEAESSIRDGQSLPRCTKCHGAKPEVSVLYFCS